MAGSRIGCNLAEIEPKLLQPKLLQPKLRRIEGLRNLGWSIRGGANRSPDGGTFGMRYRVEAGGLLFVYARAGGLNVYEAASGKHLATLPCGPGHWNSPIVLQGEIILPEGNANDHATSGVLDIWSLPGGH